MGGPARLCASDSQSLHTIACFSGGDGCLVVERDSSRSELAITRSSFCRPGSMDNQRGLAISGCKYRLTLLLRRKQSGGTQRCIELCQ